MERMLVTICGSLLILLAFAPHPGRSQSPTDIVSEVEAEVVTDAVIPTEEADVLDAGTSAPATVKSTSPKAATPAPAPSSTTCNPRGDNPSCPSTTKASATKPAVVTDDIDDVGATTDEAVDFVTPSEAAGTTKDEKEIVTEAGTTEAKPTTADDTQVTETQKNATEAPDSDVTTAALEVDSTEGSVKEVDPCSGFEQGNGTFYQVKQPSGKVECFANVLSPSGWVRFYLDDGNAEIPTVAIKQSYCGVHFPYRVHLHKDSESMPSANTSISADLCAPIKGDASDPCAHRKDITIHNCNNDFFVYKFLEPLETKEICNHEGGAAVCLKKPGEQIPYEFLDNPPPTTAAPVPTTEEPEVDYGLPVIEPEDMTQEEENGTLTVEYAFPEDEDENNVTAYWAIHKDEKFRQFIANILNGCYEPAPVEPPAPVEEKEVTTTPMEPESTTVTVKTRPKFQFTTSTSVDRTNGETTTGTTTKATTTTTTTTTTTPPPTEESYILERQTVYVDESDLFENEQVTPPKRQGPVLSDNVDDDAGKGPSGRRRRSVCSGSFTADDVFYVYDTPAVSKGILQVSFVVLEGGRDANNSTSNRTKRAAPEDTPRSGVVSQDDLFAVLNNADKAAHEDEVGLEYVKHYKGRPVDVPDTEDPAAGGATDDQKSIWEAHMGLFIAIIILIILCLIVVIIGILCIKCKGRKYTPEKTPLRSEEGHNPTVYENPIPEQEILKGEAPMVESHNPAYTPNGSGHHLTKGDEDNGWIVPMEELTYNERERPEVDNTRL